MRCEKCNLIMKEKEEKLLGETIRVHYCSRCGKKLVPLKEAIRVQEKVIPKIETTRKLVGLGHSIAVTLPKELKGMFRKGETVKVKFDPKEMELLIKKE